jgi:hypothetical protein
MRQFNHKAARKESGEDGGVRTENVNRYLRFSIVPAEKLSPLQIIFATLR